MLRDKILTLQGCDLFAELGERDLTRLADITRTKKLRKGEVVFFQDQPAESFFVVQSGQVKIHRISPMGKEQILHTFGRFHVFAEVAALDGQPYPATATATERSVVLSLGMGDFRALLARAPDMSTAIIATLCHRLRSLSRLAADLTLKDVDARVAQYLLDLAPAGSGPSQAKPCTVTLPTTKADLAARLGTVNETLSRTLTKLAKAGLIRVEGDTIRLLRPADLAQVAEPSGEKKSTKRLT